MNLHRIISLASAGLVIIAFGCGGGGGETVLQDGEGEDQADIVEAMEEDGRMDLPEQESADAETEDDVYETADVPAEEEVTTSGLKITFVDNNQFVLEFGGVVVYTDVFFPIPAGAPDPDLIKISHEHSDHFDPVLVAEIANRTGAAVVGPAPVIEQLSGSVPSGQLVQMSPPPGGREGPTDAAGVAVTTYGESTGPGHGWSHILEAGGFRIFDAGCSALENFVAMAASYSEMVDVDAAMLAWYDRAQFVAAVHPSLTIMMHFEGYCEVYLGESGTPIIVESGSSYEF